MVCVIGAQGTLGSAVVKQFEAAGWRVHPAGRRPDKREGFIQVDLDRAETVEPLLERVDLIVSTVCHTSLNEERLVLERGGVLVNCTHFHRKEMASLAASVQEAKGTVLLNAGLVPGISNLAAAKLLKKHPQADCLEVALTVLNKGTAGREGGEIVYEGLTSPGKHPVMKLSLPEPFGELPCIGATSQEEDFGFGGVAGSRDVKLYLAFGDRWLSVFLRAHNALGLLRIMPKVLFRVNRGPQAEPSREPTVIWLGARRGAERLGASIVQCEGDYRTTAAAGHLFSERLFADSRPGCFSPQDL
ncbi:MAG TPA: NAD-dependent epimerase/dehydratase family protein, partial [Solirubrobacteraceae bacterium]|nr:NAD-dependent epimerase/dehydratase family protein [Solirubrobacteraceae bacterium]